MGAADLVELGTFTGVVQEVWKRAAVDLPLALRAGGEQSLPLLLEALSEPRNEAASIWS